MQEDSSQRRDYETLKEDIAKLREDLRSLAGDLKKFAASSAEGNGGDEDTGDTGWQRSRKEWAEFQQKLHEAREQGEQAAEELAEEIRRRPLTSVAVALGIGYFLAKVLNLGGRR